MGRKGLPCLVGLMAAMPRPIMKDKHTLYVVWVLPEMLAAKKRLCGWMGKPFAAYRRWRCICRLLSLILVLLILCPVARANGVSFLIGQCSTWNLHLHPSGNKARE